MRSRPSRHSRTSASKRGPRWSMMGCAIARTMRSGTSVGPGIWRKGRPDGGDMSRSLAWQCEPQAGARGVACAKLGEAEVMAAAGIRGLLITTEIVPPTSIARLMKLVAEAPDTMIVVDHAENVAAIGTAASAAGVVVNVLVDVDMGNRRTGAQPGEPALALARAVTRQRSLRLRGLQGYAGHCAHVIGWKARREASLATMAGLMDTRQLLERQGLPVEVVAGGSTGTYDIDVELAGLTELQSGSYCVMDLEYRKIGGRDGDALTGFGVALTVLTTVG